MRRTAHVNFRNQIYGKWNKTILVRPFWSDAQTASGQPTKKKIIPGEYKKEPNSVRLQNGEMFHYASPEETPSLMNDLVNWYRGEAKKGETHPVELAALLHYKFVRIHPFDDSNGRTSRLLMNYELLRNGLPPVIIKSADKKGYLFALNKADVGDVDAFVEYIGNQLKWSLELNIKAAKGESVEEKGDLKKEIAVISQRLNIDGHKVKHPAILNEVFKWFSKKAWAVIREELHQFDELFSEMKESHYVNHGPELFEKKRAFENPLLISTGPAKIKIFGRDIYEDDIEQVEWILMMYGLKGAKKKPDLEVKIQLIFHHEKYTIRLSLDYKTLFDKGYYYDDVFLDTVLEDMKSLLSKSILEEIKIKTGIV